MAVPIKLCLMEGSGRKRGRDGEERGSGRGRGSLKKEKKKTGILREAD